MDTKEQPKHVVLWSGGCDSTLILNRAAREYGTPRRPVLALTIDHRQVRPKQRELEARARKRILAEMAKRGLAVTTGIISVNMDRNAFISRDGGGNGQAFMWAANAVGVAPDRSTLYFGYVLGSSFWPCVEPFRRAIAAYAKVLGKEIAVVFTLEYTSKASIIAELKREGLYDLCWYCENPTGRNKPCGDCHSCRSHIMALKYIEQWPEGEA